jgi:hypothetical protein
MSAIVVRAATANELDAAATIIMVAAYAEYLPLDPTGPCARLPRGDPRRAEPAATLVVAADAARIVGAVTYYPDANQEGHRWPPSWAAICLLADGHSDGHISAGLTEIRVDGCVVTL